MTSKIECYTCAGPDQRGRGQQVSPNQVWQGSAFAISLGLSHPFWCVKLPSTALLLYPSRCRRDLTLPVQPVFVCATRICLRACRCLRRSSLSTPPDFVRTTYLCSRGLSVSTRPVGANATLIFVFARLSSANFKFVYASCLRPRDLYLFARLVFCLRGLSFVYAACLLFTRLVSCLRSLSRLVGVTTARRGLRGISV
jgi:hypothetical protein